MLTVDASEVAHERLGAGLIGAAGLVLVWLAWSGRWRSWADNPMAFWLITVAPPTCTLFLLYGLTGFDPTPIVAVPAVLIMLWWLAGWMLFLVAPRWYGPRWFRERRRDPRMDRTAASATVLTTSVSPERSSEARARKERRPATPIARRRVLFVDPALGRPTALHTEGTAAGHLLLYPDELVFVADRGDDALRPGPTIRSLPADAITGLRPGRGLRVAGGRLRQGEVHVEAGDRRGWTVEPLRRNATLSELRRVYPARQNDGA